MFVLHSLLFLTAMLTLPSFHLHDTLQAMYDRSLQDSDGFWAEQARSLLSWFREFDHVQQGSLNEGDIAWFIGGKVRVLWFAALVCTIVQ
jgi:Acetyl-coenzyme A synthetase N-terminus